MTAQDGRVTCWKHGDVRYAACWPEGTYIGQVIERAARDAGLPLAPLPDHQRVRTTARYRFTFDYADATVTWEKRT